MIDAREDLWPSDFPGPSDPAPVALLKEQAELLGRKTNGDIEGVVRMIIENGIAYYTMFLKATPVGDLMVAIFSISFPAFDDTDDVYPISAKSFGDEDSDAITLGNDEDFRKWLRYQFSSKHVMSTIVVLKNYIREVRDARASWAS